MSKKPKEEVKVEKPSKKNKYALREDLESVEKEEGEAVTPKKDKKKVGVVALKHASVLNRATSGVTRKIDGKTRKMSIYQAMIEEGYSPEYARQGGLRKTKSWDKLLVDRLGDDKLSNIHSQLMVAKKLDYMLFTHEIKDDDIYDLIESVGCQLKKLVHGVQGTHVWFFAPDNKTRKDALELSYKVRGKMAAEKLEVESTGLRAMTDAELADVIKKQKARFQKKD